jgi:hypothetical protein
MARPQLPPGTWGEFTKSDLPDGRVEVVVRFRRIDGTAGKTRTKADALAAAKRELKARLPMLVNESRRNTLDIENPTLADVAAMWLEEERVTKRLSPASLHENEGITLRGILEDQGHALHMRGGAVLSGRACARGTRNPWVLAAGPTVQFAGEAARRLAAASSNLQP